MVVIVAALATALSAQASGGKALRVDRPEKGAGAHVTTVHIVRGTVSHRMRAVVLTDTRCTPDAQGVSHCLNRMRLVDGTVVTVQHDHRMMNMPCLSPGEHVTLTPDSAGTLSVAEPGPRSRRSSDSDHREHSTRRRGRTGETWFPP